MSKLFNHKVKAFPHGLGCELLKQQIIALNETRNYCIQEYRSERKLLCEAYRWRSSGLDNIMNIKAMELSMRSYQSEIIELEYQVAQLRDRYHDRYNDVYELWSGEKSKSGVSNFEQRFHRQQTFRKKTSAGTELWNVGKIVDLAESHVKGTDVTKQCHIGEVIDMKPKPVGIPANWEKRKEVCSNQIPFVGRPIKGVE